MTNYCYRCMAMVIPEIYIEIVRVLLSQRSFVQAGADLRLSWLQLIDLPYQADAPLTSECWDEAWAQAAAFMIEHLSA